VSIGRAFKGGWGFHPLMARCDNSAELLATIARPGNAGSAPLCCSPPADPASGSWKPTHCLAVTC
jgi:hypothetical protein